MSFNFRSRNQPLATFSVSSLTDIVMLLLIFFMLTSAFVMQPGIQVKLPTAQTAEPTGQSTITLTVRDNGTWFVNSTAVTRETLIPELMKVRQADAEPAIVLRADRTIPLSTAVEVIDLAKSAGFTRFLIATEGGAAQPTTTAQPDRRP